jgi:hypothetical protein
VRVTLRSLFVVDVFYCRLFDVLLIPEIEQPVYHVVVGFSLASSVLKKLARCGFNLNGYSFHVLLYAKRFYNYLLYASHSIT